MGERSVMKSADTNAPLPDIFQVPVTTLVCNLCGSRFVDDVTNPGGERTIKCRGRYDNGPCPNISREGRIGRYGFSIGRDHAVTVEYLSTAQLLAQRPHTRRTTLLEAAPARGLSGTGDRKPVGESEGPALPSGQFHQEPLEHDAAIAPAAVLAPPSRMVTRRISRFDRFIRKHFGPPFTCA